MASPLLCVYWPTTIITFVHYTLHVVGIKNKCFNSIINKRLLDYIKVIDTDTMYYSFDYWLSAGLVFRHLKQKHAMKNSAFPFEIDETKLSELYTILLPNSKQYFKVHIILYIPILRATMRKTKVIICSHPPSFFWNEREPKWLLMCAAKLSPRR